MPSNAMASRTGSTPLPVTGLSPPRAKPEAWLPIVSLSNTVLGTPALPRK